MAADAIVETDWGESDARVRIQLGGEIDMLVTDQLAAVIADVCVRGPRAVEVDLGRVTFFGSTGIEFLVRLHTHGGTFDLKAVPADVVRVLELTGVDKLLLNHDRRTPPADL